MSYYEPGSLKALLCRRGVDLLAGYAEELREVEPHAVGVAALHSPATAIAEHIVKTSVAAAGLRGVS